VQRLIEELHDLKSKGLYRALRHYQRYDATRVIDQTQPLINFASNDYLGLTSHPALAKAFHEGIDAYGTGSGASRLVSGGSPVFNQLEEALAKAKQKPAALYFSTGYAAALGTIPAIVGKNDFVILDKLSHACLIDASKLSGATLRIFPHNDLNKLERILQKIRSTHPADTRILVVTESVFSMDGDLCPLADIIACKERYQATLLLDEAHGFGVLGPHGGGLAEALGNQEGVDIHMGTLSKAAGVSGGFIAADRAIIDLLINRARSLIYSTAPPPALVAAVCKAVELIRNQEGNLARTQLRENVTLFCHLMDIPPSPSAIIPILLGDNQRALKMSADLRDAGFLVPAIRYPTVPPKTARLRISLSAAQTPDQITQLASHLNRLLTIC
jgi:8-amino-7-oxononanoate synthase